MKIVLLESLGVPDALLSSLAEPLRAAGHTFEAYSRAADEETIIAQAQDADVLMLANMPLSGRVIRACKQLKFIDIAFTGVDHVDLAAAKEMGVAASNAAGYSTQAVAELTIGQMLALLRNVPQVDARCRAGGTKQGLLFGEALVLTNPALKKDFRYLIKQHGGLLAKGRLLGVQFDALMTDNLYFDIAGRAVRLADQIRATLEELQVAHLVPGITNQIFPILSDTCLEELAKEFCFTEMERVSDTHRAIRFCTSWATTQENVDKLCDALRKFANM